MRRKLIAGGVIVAIVVVAAWLWHGRRGGEHPGAGSGSGGGSAARAVVRRPIDARPGSLAGRVTNKADGAAIAGAVVAIVRVDFVAQLAPTDNPPVVVQTGSDGTWRAPDLQPATYQVSASAAHFVPQASERLAVAPGQARGGVDLALVAGGTVVRGTVSDILGGPIGGARVSARQSGRSYGGEVGITALTGPDGKYELTLADGGYVFAASHDEYAGKIELASVTGKPLTIDFTLVPGASVRGQVVARDTGKPVAGALVMVQGDRDQVMRFRGLTSIAADDGTFQLHGLPSGAIAVTAAASGYASASPVTVELGIGEAVEGIRIVVDPAFSISGRVVAAGTRDGVAGAQLGGFSIAQRRQVMATGPTDASGAFEIVGARPGSYMLFAGGEGLLPEIGHSVEVVDRDVTDITIEIAAGVTISGRVEPAAQTTLGLELTDGAGLENIDGMIKAATVHAESDATGAFTLHHAPSGKFTLSARTADGRVGNVPVAIDGADLTNVVVHLEQRGRISGRVIDTHGAPVAGVEVRAAPDQPLLAMNWAANAFRDTPRTSEDGSFEITGLEPTTYRLFVGDLGEVLGSMRAKKNTAPTVDVPAGGQVRGITVTVPAKDGVIRGSVLDADHRPVADAWITVADDGGGGTSFRAARVLPNDRPPVLSGADGKFVVTHLAQGTYVVTAESVKGAARAERTGVKTGDAITLELALLGTLKLHVTRGGAAVPEYDISCSGAATIAGRHANSADGTFTLDHLAPGDYACTTTAPAGTATATATVASAPVALELQLDAWATITGTVVSVLSQRPLPDVVATSSQDFADLFGGTAPKTDAAGRFRITRATPGKGRVRIMPPHESFKELASRDYDAQPGATVDIGQIAVVPPRTTDAGTLGFSTDVEGGELTVTSVQSGGPAERAGLRIGDKLTSLDGRAVSDIGPEIVQLALGAGTIGAGTTVTLGLARGGSVTITAVKW